MMNETLKRILSSIVIIPVVTFFIIEGSILFNFFILGCYLITSYEWHMMSNKKSYYLFGFIFQKQLGKKNFFLLNHET